MSLGSSIGNFSRDEAAKFLKEFAQALQLDDTMLIGLDGCKDKEKVFRAYNDEKGLTHKFIRNGLSHANKILGANVFKEKDWIVIGEYDEQAGCHQAFYSPVQDTSFDNVNFRAGEKIRIEQSYKYSEEERSRLWRMAGLSEGARWTDSTGDYCEYLKLILLSKGYVYILNSKLFHDSGRLIVHDMIFLSPSFMFIPYCGRTLFKLMNCKFQISICYPNPPSFSHSTPTNMHEALPLSSMNGLNCGPPGTRSLKR